MRLLKNDYVSQYTGGWFIKKHRQITALYFIVHPRDYYTLDYSTNVPGRPARRKLRLYILYIKKVFTNHQRYVTGSTRPTSVKNKGRNGFFRETECAIMQPSMSKMSSLWFRIAPVFLLFFVSFSLLIASPSSVYAGEAPAPTPPAEGATEGEVSDESCESAGGDFSFGLCPLLRLSNDGIQLMDRKIRSSLEVNPKYFEAIPATNSNGDPNPRAGQKPIQQIWATFRNIAAIMLLPILLVLVIGTALGFSVVDAYTVKRAMPRLFIAVIFMALSYDICLIMIDVTTALGRGVGGIVAAPFGGANNLTLPAIFMPPGLPDAPDPGGVGGFFKNILTEGASIATAPVRTLVPGADTAFAVAGGLLAAMSLSAASIVSIAILASFFFVGLVLMIIIFTILAVRELVIVFLVIMSPLAILSWIFPGNDKLWKVWWDTFTKLLLVYPVIMGLIMLGRGFASLINEVGNTIDPGSIEMVFFVISKLAVYIGPFFLIMFVLKILTGAFGTFTGMMNDKRRGFFDKQRNFRAGKRKELKERAAAGYRYKGNNAISKAMSRGVQTGTIVRGGKFKRAAIAAERTTIQSEQMAKAKEHSAVKTVLNNDDLLNASAHGDQTSRSARQYLESIGQSGLELDQNVASIEAAKKAVGAENFNKVAAVANAGTGTGYAGGFAEMAAGINQAAGGNRALAVSMLAEARGNAERSGRGDLAGAGFGDSARYLQYMFEAGIQDHTSAEAQEVNRNITRAALSGKSAAYFAGGRNNALANMIPAMQERIADASTNLDQAQQELQSAQMTGDAATVATAQARYDTVHHTYKQVIAHTIAMQDVAAQISPENAELIGQQVLGQVIGSARTNTGESVLNTRTVLAQAEHYRSDPEFNQYRREYASQREVPGYPGGPTPATAPAPVPTPTVGR